MGRGSSAIRGGMLFKGGRFRPVRGALGSQARAAFMAGDYNRFERLCVQLLQTGGDEEMFEAFSGMRIRRDLSAGWTANMSQVGITWTNTGARQARVDDLTRAISEYGTEIFPEIQLFKVGPLTASIKAELNRFPYAILAENDSGSTDLFFRSKESAESNHTDLVDAGVRTGMSSALIRESTFVLPALWFVPDPAITLAEAQDIAALLLRLMTSKVAPEAARDRMTELLLATGHQIRRQ
jgi:hypothetical protein